MGLPVAEFLSVTTVHFDFGDRDDFADPARRRLKEICNYAKRGNITAITDESAKAPKKRPPEGDFDDQIAIVDEMFANPKVPVVDIEKLRKIKLAMRLHFNTNTLMVTLHDEKEHYPKITKLSGFTVDFFAFRPDQVRAYDTAEKSGDTRESARALRVLAAVLNVNFIANGVKIQGEQANDMLQQIYKTWLYVREHEAHSGANRPGRRIEACRKPVIKH